VHPRKHSNVMQIKTNTYTDSFVTAGAIWIHVLTNSHSTLFVRCCRVSVIIIGRYKRRFYSTHMAEHRRLHSSTSFVPSLKRHASDTAPRRPCLTPSQQQNTTTLNADNCSAMNCIHLCSVERNQATNVRFCSSARSKKNSYDILDNSKHSSRLLGSGHFL